MNIDKNHFKVGKKKSQKDKTKQEQKNKEELERIKNESLKKQKAEQGRFDVNFTLHLCVTDCIDMDHLWLQ